MSKPGDSPQFVVTLRVMPAEGDPSGIRRLRAFLKTALRRWGLRCVACREVSQVVEDKP